MQLWQETNQSSVDNLSNVRREVSRLSNNKTKEFLKAAFDELETNSKIKKKQQGLVYVHQ